MELVIREVLSALGAVFYGGLILVALLWSCVEWLRSNIARRSRGEQHDGDCENPKTVVTLVHGTWARSAEWTLPGSDLCRAIDHSFPLGLLFVRFIWSGRNSISARSSASVALESKLEELVARYPNAEHFLIGHSHGGSVLLGSLKPNLAAKISGIICLATPILIGQPRKYGPAIKQALTGIPLVLLLALFVWLFGNQSNSENGWWPIVLVTFVVGSVLLGIAVEKGFDISAAPFAVVVLLLLGFIFVGVDQSNFGLNIGLLLALAIIIYAVRGALLSRAARWKSALEHSGHLPFLSNDKVLFIRAPGDEASAVLIAAHLLSWVVDRLLTAPIRAVWNANLRVERWRELAIQHWVATVLAAGVFIFIAVASFERLPSLSGAVPWGLENELFFSAFVISFTFLGALIALLARGSGATWFLAWLVSTVLLIPMFVVVALLGLLTIGPEMAVMAFMMEITAESTPSGAWTLIQLSPDPSGEGNWGLQHSSVYQDQRAIKIMCDWMVARSEKVKDVAASPQRSADHHGA